jgi:hypothetical protein
VSSDDRAIEVLAEALRGYDLHAATRAELAVSQVEALASEGFQITDLTAEEIQAITTNGPGRKETWAEYDKLRQTGRAKLRRLSGANDG